MLHFSLFPTRHNDNDNDNDNDKRCYSAQSCIQTEKGRLYITIVNNEHRMIQSYAIKAHWNKCDFRAR